MDEKALVEEFKAGRKEAFELLVRLHHRGVYNLAYRFMNDHGGADEVVQETFMKVYHAIQSFRGESSFKSWMYRITVNTAKNALRVRGRHQAQDLEDVVVPYSPPEFFRMEKKQTSQMLRHCVEYLPAKQRQALELRIYEDLSFKEIAEIMDCPFDTAKANYRHAVMNIKKYLQTLENGNLFEDLKLAFESAVDEEEGL